MRPKMRSTRNEISTHHKRNSISLLFTAGEMKFRFGGGPRKTAHSIKANHFCFDKINACTDVPFYMISLPVVFHDILSSDIKFEKCQNDRTKITPTFRVVSCK